MAVFGTRRALLLLACSAALGVSGCSGLPRDAQGTLKRVTGGTLHVGAADNEPWTVLGPDGSVGGIEAGLIRAYAGTLDARVAWEPGAMSVLARKMKNNELDLVIGGLTADTPWSDKISPSRPYQVTRASDGSKQKMVIGVRPGENALQVSLERFLAEQKDDL